MILIVLLCLLQCTGGTSELCRRVPPQVPYCRHLETTATYEHLSFVADMVTMSPSLLAPHDERDCYDRETDAGSNATELSHHRCIQRLQRQLCMSLNGWYTSRPLVDGEWWPRHLFGDTHVLDTDPYEWSLFRVPQYDSESQTAMVPSGLRMRGTGQVMWIPPDVRQVLDSRYCADGQVLHINPDTGTSRSPECPASCRDVLTDLCQNTCVDQQYLCAASNPRCDYQKQAHAAMYSFDVRFQPWALCFSQDEHYFDQQSLRMYVHDMSYQSTPANTIHGQSLVSGTGADLGPLACFGRKFAYVVEIWVECSSQREGTSGNLPSSPCTEVVQGISGTGPDGVSNNTALLQLLTAMVVAFDDAVELSNLHIPPVVNPPAYDLSRGMGTQAVYAADDWYWQDTLSQVREAVLSQTGGDDSAGSMMIFNPFALVGSSAVHARATKAGLRMSLMFDDVDESVRSRVRLLELQGNIVPVLQETLLIQQVDRWKDVNVSVYADGWHHQPGGTTMTLVEIMSEWLRIEIYIWGVCGLIFILCLCRRRATHATTDAQLSSSALLRYWLWHDPCVDAVELQSRERGLSPSPLSRPSTPTYESGVIPNLSDDGAVIPNLSDDGGVILNPTDNSGVILNPTDNRAVI